MGVLHDLSRAKLVLLLPGLFLPCEIPPGEPESASAVWQEQPNQVLAPHLHPRLVDPVWRPIYALF